MLAMDIMVERRRVMVFFDGRIPSNTADQRRIERAVDNAHVLASSEAAGDTYETPPWGGVTAISRRRWVLRR